MTTPKFTVSARCAYHVPTPSLTTVHYDRFGRAIIYDAWHGKPAIVTEDEHKRRFDHYLLAGCYTLWVIAFILVALNA